MDQPRDAHFINSTTGRLYLSALRLAAGLLARALPEAAARLAVEVFARPRRSRRSAAPPQVPGLTPRALRIPFEGALLHGWIFGEGPTVLLVHGWEGQAAQLAPLIGPLVARGQRVVAFDHFAHGQSPGSRLRRVAPRLRAPLLLLHDEGDREVPFAHGQAVAAAWPGGHLLPLRGLGHRRLLRDPAVIQAVVEFVAPDALALSA